MGWLRLRWWHFRQLLCWLRTGHVENPHQIGFVPGMGKVDLYCVRCEGRIRAVGFDDAPAAVLDRIQELLELVRAQE